MYRTHQISLRASGRQHAAMDELLRAQRDLYNAALEERIGRWKWNGESIRKFDQFAQLTAWDHDLLRYGTVPARGTLTRLDRAFQGFFRRVKAGMTPGFPRFRSENRFNSVSYEDSSCWKLAGDGHKGTLYLKGVGHIKYRGSKRGLRGGTPKTLTVKREGNRYVATIFCADVQVTPPIPKPHTPIGIDVGITRLVTCSDGTIIRNQRQTRSSADKLAAEQQSLARKERGSNRRKKQVARVGDAHRKIRRQRRDALHKASRDLVSNHDLIVCEDLKITNMNRRPKPKPDSDNPGEYLPNGASAKAGLNREMASAGWGVLFEMLSYKAEEAGATIVTVDPKYTSQTCHECGHVDGDNRDGIRFSCTSCGHVGDADVNAARNILRVGLTQHRQKCEAEMKVAS